MAYGRRLNYFPPSITVEKALMRYRYGYHGSAVLALVYGGGAGVYLSKIFARSGTLRSNTAKACTYYALMHCILRTHLCARLSRTTRATLAYGILMVFGEARRTNGVDRKLAKRCSGLGASEFSCIWLTT